MGEQLEGKWVVPNPQVPRTFGMMNIVFGILLFLVGAGYLAWFFVAPMFQAKMVAQMKEQQATQKAERARRLTDLKSKEEAAKAKEKAAKNKEDTEKAKEEKDNIIEERAALENRVEPDLSAMTDVMGWNILADVRLAVYYYSEVISGMVLNVLMVIAGAGLLGLADWGRRLAVGVAWLKIARWVAMLIVTMVLILPMTMQKMDKVFQSIQAQAGANARGGPAPMGMTGMGQFTAIFGAITMVFGALAASVYPALSIWFLTRPPTRAACLQRQKPDLPHTGLEPGEPA